MSSKEQAREEIDGKRYDLEKEKAYKEEVIKEDMIIPGDPTGSPDDFIPTVISIDNAYLLRLKNYLFKTGLKYSVKNFVSIIARRSNCRAEKIFIYDAPPFQSPISSEDERKKKFYYDKVASYLKAEGIEIREGRTQRLKVGKEFIFKQKGVDMLLGIDMVGMEKDFPNVKQAVLLSGDSDFVPVIKKLEKQKIRVVLWTYFERKRESPFSKSNELIKAIGKEHTINITDKDFEMARLDTKVNKRIEESLK